LHPRRLRGFVCTVSEAIDLIGKHQDAGVHLLINADRPSDAESRELFTSDVCPSLPNDRPAGWETGDGRER
jgi:hypothetical protein